MLRMRAIRLPTGPRGPALDGAALAELLADAFRASPHLHDLGATLAHLGDPQLAADLLGIELRQHALHRLSRGGVAEAVGDQEAPVELLMVVDLRVDLADEDG